MGMNSSTDDLVNLSAALPWNELEAFAYRFVLDESNKEFLIGVALKSLKKTDPENANAYRAEQLADMMKRFAQNALQHKAQGKVTK